MGLGVSNPTSRLHIKSELLESPLSINRGSNIDFYITSVGRVIVGANGFGLDSKFLIDANAGEPAFRVRIDGDTKLKVHENGGITNSNGTATFALQLQNTATDLLGRGRAFSWNTYSDRRIKSNIQPIAYGLSEVLALQPKSYDHHNSEYQENGEVIHKGRETTKDIGLIAQEAYEIIPEAVSKPISDEELWTMDYTRLIPVLINAIQEQQDLIKTMEDRLKQQQVQMDALSKLVLEISTNKTTEED